jgi:hypothetical protein
MSRPPAPDRRPIWLLAGLSLVLAALFAAGLLLARPARAQDLGLEISKTLRGSQQVKVGQLLEFSIRITNTGSLAITQLDLVDEFVAAIVAPSGVGPYAKPGDPALSDTSPYSYDGAETISWSLLGGGRTLAPGAATEVIVRLRAVHPTSDLQTVNRARIARAVRSDGQSGGGGGAAVPARSDGARLPMTKSLGAPAPVRAGLPITFTIVITNDSLADIVTLPLRDVFNPAALRFESADPPPLSVDSVGGVLSWGDLLATSGRSVLRPGEAIRVETRYTALRDITDAVNTAEVSGAQDEYGNAVRPRQAQAPIRIVGPDETAPAGAVPTDAPTETPTPFATAGPRLTAIAGRTATAAAQPSATATATAPAIATLEATAAPATAVVPASLPNTGAVAGAPPAWPWLALALLGAGALLARRARP